MRNLKALILLISVLGMNTVLASTPVETLIPVENIYVPNGFDSNDSSEVVLSGHLPNLCHKSPKTKIQKRYNKIMITVTALKYDPTNPFCAQVLVPFIEPVSLGVLDKGNYDIEVNGKSIYKKESNIQITESVSSAVDDHVYANVNHIEREEGTRRVKFVGYNPSDCLEFDEIKLVSNGKDVYSVLPIMKKISDHCPLKMTPFSYDLEVPKGLQSKNVLLHVRSMDGKSVNSIFYDESELN